MIRHQLAATVAAAIGVTASLALVADPAHAAEHDRLSIVEAYTNAHPEITLVVAGPELAGDDVQSSAFTVLEDGEEVPAKVNRFDAEGLDIVVLVDTSGSMAGEPMDAARHAAATFVQGLPSHTRVAVVGFGTSAAAVHGFSTDRAAQIASIGALQARGETALYDALTVAADQFAEPGRRRAIVLLSDGGDTVSRTTIDAAAARINGTDAQLWAVALVTPETDLAALERLTSGSGGHIAPAGDAAALEGAYAAVAGQLVGKYAVAFVTDRTGSVPVEIRVDTPQGRLHASTILEYPAIGAPAPPKKRESFLLHGGLLSSPLALLVGAGIMGFALLVSAAIFLVPTRRRARLGPAATGARTDRSGLSTLAERASDAASGALERNGRRGSVDRLLEQAGLSLRAGEYVVLVVTAVAVGLAVGMLLLGPAGALFLGALAVAAARLVPVVLRDRRRRKFGDQVDDLLQLISGAMRAGYGLLQAIENAAREAESPAADELRRLTTEVRLGRNLTDALEAMATRLANEDFAWVVQAIRVHHEVGGDLTEVLDRVGETIRARNRLHRQVKALSAEGRLSAYVLVALPIGLALILSVLNPGYLGELTASGTGFVLLGLAAVLLTAGACWLRRLVQPVY